MESCRLPEFKYAIFSTTGRKTKNNTALEALSIDGLLEGSTFLFQYSSMTHAPLGTRRLGELKYAISPG